MIYFFSDAHLGLGSREQSREREKYVVRFIQNIVNQKAERLFIVGDLFDYWFEYKQVIPKHFTRVLGSLANAVDSGLQIDYLIGNHDFGHKDYFEKEIGLRLHHDDISTELYGKKVYISHGDGKAFNDTGYLILKKILRSNSINSIYRMLHPDMGIGLAAYFSRVSRGHTDLKDYSAKQIESSKNNVSKNTRAEGDGLLAFAKNKIEHNGYDLVVMGHNHRAARYDFAKGSYINLGNWIYDRTYLRLSQNVCELLKYDHD